MAVLWEGMCCPLCERPISLDAGDYVAFPCVGLTNLRYKPLDDAAVHRTCLSTWRKRDHFIMLFNEALANCQNPLPLRLVVSEDGEVSWDDEHRA
jgi:transposase